MKIDIRKAYDCVIGRIWRGYYEVAFFGEMDRVDDDVC